MEQFERCCEYALATGNHAAQQSLFDLGRTKPTWVSIRDSLIFSLKYNSVTLSVTLSVTECSSVLRSQGSGQLWGLGSVAARPHAAQFVFILREVSSSL